MGGVTTPEKNAGKSKKIPKVSEIEVRFTSPPKEILHFNRYEIDQMGDFLEILLWFQDRTGTSIPVFHGLILNSDFKARREGLKNYIVKIKVPKNDEKQISRPPLWQTPPVAFNFIDCVDRIKCSEVIVRSFSHKYVKESADSSGSAVDGETLGVYVSDGSIHRHFVMDLISKSEKL